MLRDRSPSEKEKRNSTMQDLKRVIYLEEEKELNTVTQFKR